MSTRPPAKPSQVFLGLSLMSGVRPKKKPACNSHPFPYLQPPFLTPALLQI